jgi:hypothetical protein
MVSNFLKCEMLLSFPGKGFHYATRDARPPENTKSPAFGIQQGSQ